MGKLLENGIITYEGLKRMAALKGESLRGLSIKLGKADGWLGNIVGGRFGICTDSLAKLCHYFKCSPDSLVEFHGFEISKRYEGFEFAVPEKSEGFVTYKPLLELFYDTYGGEDWKRKLTEFYDQVESSYYENLEDKEKERLIAQALKMSGKTEKKKSGPTGKAKNGLGSSVRVGIRTDKPVRLYHIYDLCRKLKCPIGRVMSYK